MLQTDVGKGLSCQDRFHNIRRKRGQLQHTPDVAAVDALLFGDVLEVFELPRFQLLLPCVRFGQGRQQRVVRDRSFNGIRFDTVSQDHLPANRSPIVLWPYPIDPWPGEPLPDEYDMLIYAKNGHRPQLLEYLAELFPRHIQIHYGQYKREQLFEAARRSRACAYLADDDHGPLALQEILLAGCPTVGVRTGASFVRDGVTGCVVDRLPPGQQCVENDADQLALAVYLDAVDRAQSLDRDAVRAAAEQEFCTQNILSAILVALDSSRVCR
jgi:hypothetical protein